MGGRCARVRRRHGARSAARRTGSELGARARGRSGRWRRGRGVGAVPGRGGQAGARAGGARAAAAGAGPPRRAVGGALAAGHRRWRRRRSRGAARRAVCRRCCGPSRRVRPTAVRPTRYSATCSRPSSTPARASCLTITSAGLDESLPAGAVRAWLMALVAHDPVVDGDPWELAALAEQLDEWWAAGRRYTAQRMFRTCFRLVPPGDGEAETDARRRCAVRDRIGSRSGGGANRAGPERERRCSPAGAGGRKRTPAVGSRRRVARRDPAAGQGRPERARGGRGGVGAQRAAVRARPHAREPAGAPARRARVRAGAVARPRAGAARAGADRRRADRRAGLQLPARGGARARAGRLRGARPAVVAPAACGSS